MSFINFPSPTPVFPSLPVQGWSVYKKPIMMSDVTAAVSGREVLLIRAAYPRWDFEVTFGTDGWLREQTQNAAVYAPLAGKRELEQISELFLSCLGSYGEFYFSDPQDNSRLAQTVGTGTGSATVFPLYYYWGDPVALPGGFLEFYAPVSGINAVQTVYFNGAPISPAFYTIDATNTALVFSPAPGSGVVITADFTFYFRCRFVDDKQDYSQWAKNLWEYRSCKFRSVKP
jgi:uncharacterized protein (TIGR02217 family)